MENLNVTIENGVKTLELRTGDALPIKAPLNVNIVGTIFAPLKWLQKRIPEIDQLQSHILIDREEMTIELVLNETETYQKHTIKGKLQIHPIFKKFAINSGIYKTTFDMAELFKMNRSYFENHQVAMELVSQLREFQAKINKDFEIKKNPNSGDQKILKVQVVESNIPKSFNVVMPIFKGMDPVKIEVETYFNPDDLTCTLISPAANDQVEDIRNSAIDEMIEEIKTTAPNIAMIEI